MLSVSELDGLAARFAGPEVTAIALMGSYARGDAGSYSDVDLVRFAGHDAVAVPGDGSYLVDGRLVVVSTHTPASVERIFTDPAAACESLLGLRMARPLLDREATFAAIQARALAFRWDAAMQARANQYAGDALVGWIEEVHKGLEGLRRADTGRLLNAQFGLSWGLSRVMMVQRGVLLAGDNDIWAAINRTVGEASVWVKLRRAAFGLVQPEIGKPLLHQQVAAGLALYVETVALLRDCLVEPAAGMILATTALIQAVLGQANQEGTSHGRT